MIPLLSRRRFLQAFSLSLPLGCMDFPRWIEKAADVASRPEMKTGEFAVLGMGVFGKRVIRRFRSLRRANPIKYPCSHITMDLSAEDGFIEMMPGDDPIPAIAACAGAEFICLVADPREPESMFCASHLARILRGASKKESVLITPQNPLEPAESSFSTIIRVRDSGIESALLLMTLHHAYLGCTRIGSVICFKANFPEAAAGKKGDARICSIPLQGFPSEPVFRTILQHTWNSLPPWGSKVGSMWIWEMPADFDYDAKFLDLFSWVCEQYQLELDPNGDLIVLAYPSTRSKELKVTLIRFDGLCLLM